MTNFHIKLDDKFEELFEKAKEKPLNMTDLVDLKSYIYDVYSRENSLEDESIKKGFHMIDFKI